MTTPCIITIDEGTTGTRALLIDAHGQVQYQAYRELSINYPQPGWVEQDAQELWEKTAEVLGEVYRHAPTSNFKIEAIAIANQRETTIAWDRTTGEALHPAIVWQCRRTNDLCKQLRDEGCEPIISQLTGLPVDPYFSATKMAWLLDNIPQGREGAEAGNVCLGTVDAWLLWHLTAGKEFATDVTNASRTQLLNIHSCAWDPKLSNLFRVPITALPQVHKSGHRFGETRGLLDVPDGIPILAMIGDSQAALFGEAAFKPGMSKVTYGTGSSVLLHVGNKAAKPAHGLGSTIAWHVGDDLAYAVEGIIHVTGAAMQWLRDSMGLYQDTNELEGIANSVSDTGGVFLVPAFAGLGTPWWDADARGLLIGLTRGTKREHIIRAGLDSIALQVYDVFAAMENSIAQAKGTVFCGGGGSRNGYLMQLQADLLDRPVVTCQNPEASAMGAAYIAGLTAGLWDYSDITAMHDQTVEKQFEPNRERLEITEYIKEWHEAVNRSLAWKKSKEGTTD